MGELHVKYQQRLAETTNVHDTELTNLRTGYDAAVADNNGLPSSSLVFKKVFCQHNSTGDNSGIVKVLVRATSA